MKCRNHGYCSPSKATQSDDFISSTSSNTESSPSGSMEVVSIKQSVAKKSERMKDASDDLTNLHKFNRKIYVRWGILLSFGILLWITLCITDIFYPSGILKSDIFMLYTYVPLSMDLIWLPNCVYFMFPKGWFADIIVKKKLHQQEIISESPEPEVGRLNKIYSRTWRSCASITAVEVLIFFGCVLSLICVNPFGRSRLVYGITQYFNKYFKSLPDVGVNLKRTDSNNFDVNSLEQKLNSSSKCNCDGHHSALGCVTTHYSANQGKIENKFKLSQQNTFHLYPGETELTFNYNLKSLMSRLPSNNLRELTVQTDKDRAATSSSKENDKNHNAVESEVIFDNPNSDLHYKLSVLESDRKTFKPDLCIVKNDNQSLKNVGTSTSMENLDFADKVMHTFDPEIQKCLKIDSNVSPSSSSNNIQDELSTDSTYSDFESNVDLTSEILNDQNNAGMVSSSPAFRKFLANLSRTQITTSFL